MGGVDFALQRFENEPRPRYLSFLEVLTEFSTKLIKQDKATVLQYLEQLLPDGQHPQTQVILCNLYIEFFEDISTLSTSSNEKYRVKCNREFDLLYTGVLG